MKKKVTPGVISVRIDKLVGIKRTVREVSIEIDKLTNSIENARSGDTFNTGFYRMTNDNKAEIKKKDWLFDWHKEIKYQEREIYKLTIEGNSDIIQGLISLSTGPDHVFVHLIENAKFNIGKSKEFIGVAGNMFAFACKKSKEIGFDGFVVFIAKTKLIEYYKETLGAKLISAQRMIIEDREAAKLINQYFKS